MKKLLLAVLFLFIGNVHAQWLNVSLGIENWKAGNSKWVTITDTTQGRRLDILEEWHISQLIPYVELKYTGNKWDFEVKTGVIGYHWENSFDPEWQEYRSSKYNLPGAYFNFKITYKIDLREKE